MRFNSPL